MSVHTMQAILIIIVLVLGGVGGELLRAPRENAVRPTPTIGDFLKTVPEFRFQGNATAHG